MVARSCALAVLVVACLPGALAWAATQVDSYPAEGRSGGVVIVDGSDAGTRITVDRKPESRKFVVKDRRVVAGANCRQSSRAEAVCANRGYLVVLARGGRDLITLGPDLGHAPNELIAGPGADVIIGGPGRDWLIGGIGNDRLFGLGGNDFLYGETANLVFTDNPGDNLLVGGSGNDEFSDRYETGRDTFLGGPGNDRLNSQDEAEDAQISGGDGFDRCRVDSADPEPRSCEALRTAAR